MIDWNRRDRAAAAGCCGMFGLFTGMLLGGGFGGLLWLAPAIASWWRAL